MAGASACIPILAVCDWEGTACVIAQDVVSSDFHVRFRSNPGHPVVENSREAERAFMKLWPLPL